MGGARMSALVIAEIVDRRPHLGVVNGPLSPAARADQARRGAIAVMMDRCAHYVAVINPVGLDAGRRCEALDASCCYLTESTAGKIVDRCTRSGVAGHPLSCRGPCLGVPFGGEDGHEGGVVPLAVVAKGLARHALGAEADLLVGAAGARVEGVDLE